MIHLLPLPAAATPPARLPSHPVLPVLWPASVLWLIGMALCLLVALATLPRSAWAPNAPPAAAATVTAGWVEPPAAAQPRSRLRCMHCGVVEVIRRLEPVGSEPAGYEFIVRLRDGSARVSTVVAATASAWAVGDSIMLVGGL